MEHLICSVFRSSQKDECYLYVDKKKGIAGLPEELLSLFGRPTEVMTLLLKPEKPLARVDVNRVIASIREHGYYLQLPPPMDAEMQKIHQLNDKIPR